MFNLNVFKGAINIYDVQRPNLFEVKFNIPRNLRFGSSETDFGSAIRAVTGQGTLITLLCKSATLPGAALGLAESRRYGIGPTVRTPIFSSSSPDVSLTFISDSFGLMRSVFVGWMRCIYEWTPTDDVGEGKNYQLGYKSDYSSTLEIVTYHGEKRKYKGSGVLQALTTAAFSAAGTPFLGSNLLKGVPSFPLKKVRTTSLYKAFPISVSEMSLSHDSSSTISEFTVNFSYFDWSDYSSA